MDNIKEQTSLSSQNCSQGPPAEKTGRGSLLSHPSCPSDVPVGQGTELNMLDSAFTYQAGQYVLVQPGVRLIFRLLLDPDL